MQVHRTYRDEFTLLKHHSFAALILHLHCHDRNPEEPAFLPDSGITFISMGVEFAFSPKFQFETVNKLKFLDEQRVCDEAVNVTRRHGLE